MKRADDEAEIMGSGPIKDKQLLDMLVNNVTDSVVDKLDRQYAATDWRVGLERTQRIFLGLDDEPMAFDESTIARMLKTVASDYDGLSDEFIVLHAVANALLGVDGDFKMRLIHKRRGKFKPPDVQEAEFERRMSILYSVASLEKKGWKTEAAVARKQERFGISRAAVFADIKAAEEFLASCRKIFGPGDNNKSPRSSDFEN